MTHFVLAQQASSSPYGLLLPFVLMFGIFYLLFWRPMKRRQKSQEEMITNLKNGDKVITNSGIYGTVAGLKEFTLILKIADNVKIELAKNAIASLQAPPKEPAGK